MRLYPKNSVFLFITGHHHKGLNKSNEAILGETDAGLHASIGSEWECFDKKLGKKCKKDNEHFFTFVFTNTFLLIQQQLSCTTI